jgi:LacI family transcriptional regulator, galactose operon repressor
MLSLPHSYSSPPSGPSYVNTNLVRGAAAADAPRVLAILNMGTGWSRGVLRGFMAAAHERRWTVLHYPPPVDLDALVQKFAPSAVLIGPDSGKVSSGHAATLPIVSVALDLSSEGIPSVCPDEERIGALALDHLLATGLRQVSTFRLDGSAFGVARERAFLERALKAGARVAVGWGSDRAPQQWRGENAEGLIQWLLDLPKPCGLFTCADHWARIVARYVRLAGLRVPDDIALIGVDNDVVECELLAPPLSSVMVPWQELGNDAARLVQRLLHGQRIERPLCLVPPLAVAARRSSEVMAIEDALVAKAVGWIHQNAQQRLNVPMVAAAVGGGRKRLERRFRRALDRTVQEEIRRARVERAKGLLQNTRASLPDVARQSGFSNAALLSVAFKREVGIPPGSYRRRVHEALAGTHER